MVLEACPCDGCPHACRCSSELLACWQFKMFVVTGCEARWRPAPRRPERAIYERVFPDDLQVDEAA
jgi:hypothetical protein